MRKQSDLSVIDWLALGALAFIVGFATNWFFVS
jgi:hypothetical protein